MCDICGRNSLSAPPSPGIHFFSDPPFSKCEIEICSPGCSLFHRVSGNGLVLYSINWSTSSINEILFFTEFLCSHYCSSGPIFFLPSIQQVDLRLLARPPGWLCSSRRPEGCIGRKAAICRTQSGA